MAESKGESAPSAGDNFMSSVLAGVVSGVIVLIMGPSVEAWWHVHGAEADRQLRHTLGVYLEIAVFGLAAMGLVALGAVVVWVARRLWRGRAL
jgi:hypothetical protein